MFRRHSDGLVRSALTFSFLVAFLGCGPSFFTAKGTVSSSGGQLGSWSVTPIACNRDEFDGDSSKLITMLFRPPQSNDPDRDLHRDQQPDSLLQLQVAKNGSGYMAQLKTMKGMENTLVDASNCKKLTLDRTEHSAGMTGLRPTLNGELTMDCTVKQSHVTADVTFKKCGM